MKKRIFELDSLRGIAALMVVIFHFTYGIEQFKYGFKYGCTGVDLFFIISGFVIIMSVEKVQSWKDFLVSRFSRLYPAYWICVSLTTIAIVVSSLIANHNSEGLVIRYLANMTMFQYYLNIEDIDGPYWTLIIELIFYFFITILIITKLLKKIEIISFIIICFIFLYGHYYFAIHYVYILDKLIPLLNYFPLFFSGILFYKMKFEKVTLLRIIMLVICFFAQLYLFKDHYHNRHVINRLEYTVILVLYYSIFILFVSEKLGFIVNFFTSKLGLISYSLYLIHQFIGRQVLIPFLLNYMNYTAALFIALMVVIGISLVIYTFIEKPALLFIRNQYKSKSLFSVIK